MKSKKESAKLRIIKIFLIAFATGWMFFSVMELWYSKLTIFELPALNLIQKFVILIFFLSSIFAFWNKRWAWWISISILILLSLLGFANLIYVYREYAYGTTFEDSPMTLWISIILFIPKYFFAFAILIMMFLQRHEIKELLSFHRYDEEK